MLALLGHAAPLLAQGVAGSRRDVAVQSGALALPAENTAALPTSPGSTSPSVSGLGSEFGQQQIVQRRAHVEPWSAAVDAQYFYTDNAALASSHARGDGYLRGGATIGYTNRVKGPVFLDFSLQQYFFRYAKYSTLDFDLTRFEGGVLYEAHWLMDSFFFGRYRLERINEPGFGHAFFTSHVAELGIQKVWKISRGQQISASLEADLPLDTSPGISERAEYGATVGYALRLTERLSASVSWRGFWYDYTGISRSEWNHLFALGVTYEVTDWLRLATSVSYSISDSNRDVGDYQNFIAGGSFSLQMSF